MGTGKREKQWEDAAAFYESEASEPVSAADQRGYQQLVILAIERYLDEYWRTTRAARP